MENAKPNISELVDPDIQSAMSEIINDPNHPAWPEIRRMAEEVHRLRKEMEDED